MFRVSRHDYAPVRIVFGLSAHTKDLLLNGENDLYPSLFARKIRIMDSPLGLACTTIRSLTYLLLCPTLIVASTALSTNTSSASNSKYDIKCYSNRHQLTRPHCEDALWQIYDSVPRGVHPTFTEDVHKAATLPNYIWTPLHSTIEECTFRINLPSEDDVTVHMDTLLSEAEHLISRCVGLWGVSGGHIAVRGYQVASYIWIDFVAHRQPGLGQDRGNGNVTDGDVTEAFVLPVNSSVAEPAGSSIPRPSDVLAAK